ncbi:MULTISPECIES: NUDIX domain-containing protein [unclassified Dolichospermum]|uniref:NUDIX domain-containing protein n=1 Tax=unclassified Dolichospermum TaxID=2622029 RepID=UPI0014485A9A|nr:MULTISPECIES: NUDIX domain-containing protein [unclassified Dolichospermum]MTJ15848.1 NUDIX domain-containing protein [Dolichospermum sp. UHCC 0299]MTJ41617.1 NUDIX domain-containing protein [Dolichospermum sp. UHCC 0406]
MKIDSIELLEKAKNDRVNQLVVGAFILNSNNELLLLQRDKDEFIGGLYELPSGGVEKGETLAEALVREVREETGLEVTHIGDFVNSFDYTTKRGLARQMNFITSVHCYTVSLSAEHQDFMWIAPEKLPNIKEIDDILLTQVLGYLDYNKS